MKLKDSQIDEKKTISKWQRAWNGTKNDFQQSTKLLKENIKAFVGTELFAAISLGISLLIIIILLNIGGLFNNSLTFEDYRQNFLLFNGVRLIALVLIIIIIGAYMNCQNGLAWEIMSSGEMFTQVKSSFAYFKKYWWQYSIISILLFIFEFRFSFSFNFFGPTPIDLNTPNSGPPSQSSPIGSNYSFIFITLIIGFVIEFIWSIFIIQTLPSITAQGKFGDSFKESWRMLRSNFPRLVTTWGIYFLIFYVPLLILNIIIILLFPSFQNAGNPLDILRNILLIIQICIGLPYRAIISTGLYNNVEFKRIEANRPQNQSQ